MAIIGAHVSAAGGVSNAPLNAVKEELETFQMFSRPPQTFRCPPLSPEEIARFITNCKTHQFKNYYIHAPYLINLASANPRLRHGSITMLREELERGSLLKAKGVMFHVGSAASQPSRVEAIAAAINSLADILDGYTGTCKLLLENAAGSGSVLGCTFEELAQLAAGVKQYASKIGFCLDTQHAFGSGYDLRTKETVDQLVHTMQKTIGLKKLVVVQVNDSKVEFNSKKDRHEHINKGHIGAAGFKALLQHPQLAHLDFVLETPFEEREQDVALLKKLRN
jgi:apurinic endonuclease APN1